MTKKQILRAVQIGPNSPYVCYLHNYRPGVEIEVLINWTTRIYEALPMDKCQADQVWTSWVEKYRDIYLSVWTFELLPVE